MVGKMVVAAMAAMRGDADERSVLRPVCAVNLNRVVISTHSTPLQMAVCMQFVCCRLLFGACLAFKWLSRAESCAGVIG
jgi:hypothetical protein